MKFNWGTGIFLFIVLFLVSMLTVVFLSFRQSNELVESEYYPQGIEYQKQIDRRQRAEALSARIDIKQSGSVVVLAYPAEFRNAALSNAEIYFYRPSAEMSDVKIAMQPDTALMQYLPVDNLRAGKYIVKFSWMMNETEYYDEQSIMIGK